MKKVKSDEIFLMNGIKNGPKESLPSDAIEHQPPEKEQTIEQEKKIKDAESTSGFSTMSPLQKFFFILSLLLSVLYVVAFAWLIPCKTPEITDDTVPIIVKERWRYNVSEIDTTTSLILIGIGYNESLLLFGYEKVDDIELSGGVIVLDGNEGVLLWQKELPFTPRYIDCDGLDTNSDDAPKCIVIGDNGFIAIINYNNKAVVWTKQSDFQPSIVAAIPDCDSDNVPDLAVAFSNIDLLSGRGSEDNVKIGIISGRNGDTIGFVRPINECFTTINKLQRWRTDILSYDILFHCKDKDGFDNLWKISADKLCRKVSEDTLEYNFTKVYTLDEPRHTSLDVLYQPVQEVYSSNENMLVAWRGANTILLGSNDNILHWSYSTNSSADIRALLTGRFTNDSEFQVAMITSDEDSGSMLTILQRETGAEVMTTLYPKYFLTEALPLRKVFSGTDGILLKHVKVRSKVAVKNAFVSNVSSSDTVNNQLLDKVVVQEEFLISHPGCTNKESLKFVMKEKVTKFLRRNSTSENRFETSRITAAVRDTDAEDSLELFTTSMSLSLSSVNDDTSDGQNANKLTTVKLLELSHVLFSKNRTCECAC